MSVSLKWCGLPGKGRGLVWPRFEFLHFDSFAAIES